MLCECNVYVCGSNRELSVVLCLELSPLECTGAFAVFSTILSLQFGSFHEPGLILKLCPWCRPGKTEVKTSPFVGLSHPDFLRLCYLTFINKISVLQKNLKMLCSCSVTILNWILVNVMRVYCKMCL